MAPEGLFGHGVADMLTLNKVCKTDVGGRYAYNSYHLPRRGNPVRMERSESIPTTLRGNDMQTYAVRNVIGKNVERTIEKGPRFKLVGMFSERSRQIKV